MGTGIYVLHFCHHLPRLATEQYGLAAIRSFEPNGLEISKWRDLYSAGLRRLTQLELQSRSHNLSW